MHLKHNPANRAASRQSVIIRPRRSFFDVLISDLRSLVRSAGLLRAMTAMRLKLRYRQSLLGWLWGILQPMSLMALYSLIFSRLAIYGAQPLPYALFVFAGLTPWVFCSTSISTSAAGMLTYRSLMAAAYFPREIIPISFVAASLVDFAIAFAVLLLIMTYYSIPISMAAIMALPILAILTVLVIAASLLISSIQVRVRDINVALPLVLQVLVFTTPIVYPASAVPASLQSFYWLNPFAILIQEFRESVVGGNFPPAGDLLYCAVIAAIAFLISFWIFKKIEPTLVDDM